MSSELRGVEAVGRESIYDVPRDLLDEAGRSSLAGLQVVCSIRKAPRGEKKNYKSSRSPDTYDLARGLALEGHSSSPSPTLADQSGGRVLPFLDPSASLVGEAFLFFSPPLGERLYSSPPHLGERSRPRSRHPIAPENGNSSESPWPSSWPSSPAPRGVPEPAAPLGGRPLGSLAMGLDR